VAGDVGNSGRGGITGINITPLVDIMLVLLIIFMVTASVQSSKAVPVQVPKASTGVAGPSEAIQLAIDEGGTMRLDGNVVDPGSALRMMTEAARRDSATQVLISADEALDYGRVVEVLDLVRTAGVGKYALRIRAGAGEATP
jgi:biopolymer transport protein ExbD